MQVKIEMSKEEKRWAFVIVVAVIIILYYINKLYLFILDIEFEDNKPVKLKLKTGFIFYRITEINFGNEVLEQKVKFYGYIIKTIPMKDKEGKNNGEYVMEIYKSKLSKKPYKKIVIHTDSYYVEHFKTPLGKV
jgi:hypothetical protein